MDDPLWSQLLIQVILIALNAFFAATEIAVLSLNESKIRKQAEEGDKKSSKLLALIAEPAGFLSTIQVGITLAGFLGSAFAAESFAGYISSWLESLTAVPAAKFHTLAVIVVTLILSYFTLVLGELVPKRIAMKKSEEVARMALGVIKAVAFLMRPVVWFLSVSTNGVLRLFGINPKEEEEEFTEEDIRMLVDMSEKKGNIESTEKEMIENIFEFNNSCAADIMIHRTQMIALDIEDSDETILDTILESGRSRIPVYKDDIDNIIGILNIRRYLVNRQMGKPVPIEELLYEPHFVSESIKADVLFRDMQKKKIHLAIVLDEFGGTSGLITMEDLLEEIVGNIYDEFDEQVEQDIVAIEENVWRISGALDLETIGETIGFEFDEDADYTTLGGLIFSLLTEIPADGTNPEVDYENLHIKALEILDKQVKWAQVELTPVLEAEDEDEE